MTYYENWSKIWIDGFHAYCDQSPSLRDDLSEGEYQIWVSGLHKAQELEINFPNMRIEKSMAPIEARKWSNELIAKFDLQIDELKSIIKELENGL